MRRNLKDKVIVITGASSGIGAATAQRCWEAGMRVVASARRMDRLATVVGPMGERGVAVGCDVSRDEDVERLFEEAMKHFGRVDVVFANAGYAVIERIDRTSDRQARQLFETNFFGTLRCIRYGLAKLRETADGLRHVVICSSGASDISMPLFGMYSATKAAQKSVAQAMRAELTAEGVAVTSVHPAGTITEFFEVAAEVSGKPGMRHETNTPRMFEQTADQVARRVVRALRRPVPEVWPLRIARPALGVAMMLPRMTAFLLARSGKARQS